MSSDLRAGQVSSEESSGEDVLAVVPWQGEATRGAGAWGW